MRIKEIIKEKGLTVAEVAVRMGVTSPSLSRAINGNTTVDMLNRIATALDVPIASLFVDNSKSDIYGLVMFKGKTYKLDSDQAFQSFLNDYNSGLA